MVVISNRKQRTFTVTLNYNEGEDLLNFLVENSRRSNKSRVAARLAEIIEENIDDSVQELSSGFPRTIG